MDKPTVYMGADHGGFRLKAYLADHLRASGYTVENLGTDTAESCDYPHYADAVCRKVLEDEGSLGILVCGTGIGMSMSANRLPGIRAAMCTNEYLARLTRKHNDANILCLGERNLGVEAAASIADVFLATEFEGGRHARRINLMDTLARGEK